MTTPTSRRRDVRASTAAAPGADEERGARRSTGTSEEERGRLPPVATSLHVGRELPPRITSAVDCLLLAYVYRGASSLLQPHAVTTPRAPLLPLTLSLSLSFSLVSSLCRPAARRSRETPVHHRRRYPTTRFPATNPPRLSRPLPSHPPARVTSQQRSPRPRPRAETDRESSALRQSAIRLAATLRHAARCVCFCTAFSKPASERNLIARAPRRVVNHWRSAISRAVSRVHP